MTYFIQKPIPKISTTGHCTPCKRNHFSWHCKRYCCILNQFAVKFHFLKDIYWIRILWHMTLWFYAIFKSSLCLYSSQFTRNNVLVRVWVVSQFCSWLGTVGHVNEMWVVNGYISSLSVRLGVHSHSWDMLLYWNCGPHCTLWMHYMWFDLV